MVYVRTHLDMSANQTRHWIHQWSNTCSRLCLSAVPRDSPRPTCWGRTWPAGWFAAWRTRRGWSSGAPSRTSPVLSGSRSRHPSHQVRRTGSGPSWLWVAVKEEEDRREGYKEGEVHIRKEWCLCVQVIWCLPPCPTCGECMYQVTHRSFRWASIPTAEPHDSMVTRTLCVNSSFQMQLRDYPQPLLAMTEVTISGRMLFAEQEAQERGSCDLAPLNEREILFTHSIIGNCMNCVCSCWSWFPLFELQTVTAFDGDQE